MFEYVLKICVDFFSIFASAANIGLFGLGIYGIKVFWPNYKRQKKIENNCTASMNALLQLEDCEKSLRQLFKITKLAHSHGSHLLAQNEVLANLRALKNRLLPLRTNLLIKEQLFWLQGLIRKFHPESETVPSFVSSNILSEIDTTYHKEKELNLSKLEEIRTALVTIYELPGGAEA